MKLKTGGTHPASVLLDRSGSVEKIFQEEHCWNGYPNDLVVIDDLQGRSFRADDATTRLEKDCETQLEFVRQWPDCEFVVRDIWTAAADYLSWRVEVELNPGQSKRSIRIKQLFPYPYPAYRLHAWSANERFPCPLEQLGGLHLYYGDACYGTVIPAVSIYRHDPCLGVTLAKPFDLKSARLAFHFKDYHSDGVEIENSCLYLGPEKPAVAELMIKFHAGCWRPGLDWLYRKYPEYFDPPNPRVSEFEGGFMITNPYTKAEYLKTLDKYQVKWAEIHNHFPVYGDYAPDAEEWDSVITHDYPEVPPPREKLSKDKINSHIKCLHENNIKGLLYFQCSGDGYIPYAKHSFPDSIARDCAGYLIPTWKECCFLNASPDSSFGKHIDRQIDKIMNDYPEIDGVFLDQLCYQTVDYAHHDGVTACDNRPAAMFGNSYTANLVKLAGIIHPRNQVIWANGPFDIEAQKDIDGVMAEGLSGISKTYQYLCLTKPLLVHTYPNSPANVETMFRHCLLAGASYSIGASSKLPEPPPIDARTRRLFEACIPLVGKLFGRKWLLEPAPLELPPGYEGNIFRGRDGHSILVTLISQNSSMLHEQVIVEKNIVVKVRVAGSEKYSAVESFSAHTLDALNADLHHESGTMEINFREHCVMSVVVIK